MKKAVKWIVGIIVLLAMGAYGYYEMNKPVQVEFLQIQKTDVVKTFKEDGTIKAVEQRDVYATLPNKITSLGVEEGMEIHAGQHIALLDSEQFDDQIHVLQVQKSNTERLLEKTLKDLENQIEQQKMLITETNRQLEFASRELDRVTTLYSQKSATKSEVDAMQNQVNQLESTVRQQELVLAQLQSQTKIDSETVRYYNTSIQTIEKQIEQLTNQSKECQIVSPIDGIVIDVNYKEGSVVNPQLPICTVYSPNAYRIEAFVLAEDVVKLYEGMEVSVVQEQAEEDITVMGTIDFMAPSAVEKVSSLGLNEKRVKLYITTKETEALQMYPGYSVDVEFTTYREEDQIAIPKTSVFEVNGQDAVWRVEEDTAQLVYVEKGMETDIDVVITEGLSEGDVIIKNPNIDGLEEGKSVTE